jgi:adenine phosphoribosyltransferase
MIVSTTETIKEAIRNIPDFPVKGIQFKDITTAIKQPELFNLITDQIALHYIDKGITKVVAIESRGFIIGGSHDDLLATGGTALATLKLISLFNIRKAYASFIIELDYLNGRQRLSPSYDIYSLVHFDS